MKCGRGCLVVVLFAMIAEREAAVFSCVGHQSGQIRWKLLAYVYVNMCVLLPSVLLTIWDSSEVSWFAYIARARAPTPVHKTFKCGVRVVWSMSYHNMLRFMMKLMETKM